MAQVQVEPSKGDQDEKEKRMAKYPPAAEGIPKNKYSHRFINDVGEERAYDQ